MEWLSDSPWLAWLGIALILGAIEALTVDFVFLMLAGGAEELARNPTLAAIATGKAAGEPTLRELLARRGGNVDFASGGKMRDMASRDSGETWSARTADGAPAIPAGQDVIVLTLQGAIAVVAPAAPRRELPST